MISFVASYSCQLAHLLYHVLKGVVAECFDRLPTIFSWILKWLQVESLTVDWAQAVIEFEEANWTTRGISSVCMLDHFFWFDFATF